MITVLGQGGAGGSTRRPLQGVGLPVEGREAVPETRTGATLQPLLPAPTLPEHLDNRLTLDNLLTWITPLTFAADQTTPTNRLAALPKGNSY